MYSRVGFTDESALSGHNLGGYRAPCCAGSAGWEHLLGVLEKERGGERILKATLFPQFWLKEIILSPGEHTLPIFSFTWNLNLGPGSLLCCAPRIRLPPLLLLLLLQHHWASCNGTLFERTETFNRSPLCYVQSDSLCAFHRLEWCGQWEGDSWYCNMRCLGALVDTLIRCWMIGGSARRQRDFIRSWEPVWRWVRSSGW